MEEVFQAFRQTGFFRASEDHGRTAIFGGITRNLAMDRGALAESFRKILRDIKNGGFAQRFQVEAESGYPMLEFARAMIHGPSPISDAENRIRRLMSPTVSGAGVPAAATGGAIQREGVVASTQHVANGLELGLERRSSWPARLIRAPRHAKTAWKNVPEGTPWMYKLIYVGAYLKAMR